MDITPMFEDKGLGIERDSSTMGERIFAWALVATGIAAFMVFCVPFIKYLLW